jgi:hypothetical protein
MSEAETAELGRFDHRVNDERDAAELVCEAMEREKRQKPHRQRLFSAGQNATS